MSSSSYYSQNLKYKTQNQKHYQHKKSNHTVSRATVENVGSDDDDNVDYLPPKKMSAFANSSFVGQKAGGSTSSTYVSSDYTNSNSSFKYDATPSKINSHLLDHGYGATPQPTFSSASDETGFKGYTKSADFGITSYYKAVKRRINTTPPPLNMSPTPPKQAKHTPTKVSASSAASKKRFSEGTR